MRKLIVIALALSLSGCAGLQAIQSAYQAVEGTTVSPQQIVIAANAFNALQGTATQYLIYCKPRLTEPVCSANNRRTVIRAVRAGRAARNQLETYISSGQPAPAQIYNTLIAIVNSLSKSPATQVVQ